jgi:hypothetical protein
MAPLQLYARDRGASHQLGLATSDEPANTQPSKQHGRAASRSGKTCFDLPGIAIGQPPCGLDTLESCIIRIVIA